jgi:hypothetical protein
MTRLNAGRVSDRSSGSSSLVAESASAAAIVATGHLSGDDGFTNNCLKNRQFHQLRLHAHPYFLPLIC